MTSTLHIKDSEILARHRANIAASLARRIEAAKASQDEALVALLEQERHQLGLDRNLHDHNNILDRVKAAWNGLVEAIANGSELSVRQIQDTDGNTWWYAHDPRSGMSLYAENESEIVKWIEDNYLGH